MTPFKKVLKYFLIWRLAIFIPVIIGGIYLNYGTSFPFFQINYFQPNLPAVIDHSFIKAWSNFDGVHYVNIASKGYVNEARFFPFLPIIIYVLSIGNLYFPLTFLISIILPNFIFLAALDMFYKLLKLDYNEKVSLDTIKLLIIYPLSFFFITVYTEGLFLLLTITSFYFMRKKMWLYAALTAMLLASTRFVGIFIIPALILEYITTEKPKNLINYSKIILYSAVSSLGLIAYSIFNFVKWNDFLYHLNAHGDLGNGRSTSGLVIPPQAIYRYLKILMTMPYTYFEWWIALLELSSFLFGTLLLFIAWKKKVRLSYLLFASLAFLLPSFSGTFSGLPRYVIVAFPIFIAMALIDNKYFKVLYFSFSIILLFLLLMFFTKGYFIA